jgi:hypothetical protein
MSTVTMQELEFETAELLPSRETLSSCNSSPCCGSSVTQVGLVNINNSFNNIEVEL